MRPNVLFLFTDDQRFDTIHALGNEQIKTPNLDRLVRNGTTFTHAHIMGSTVPAVCICSRATLLMGRTLFRSDRHIPENMALWPEVMDRAGYKTYGVGKWHNGEASFARGFSCGDNIFFGGMCNHLRVPVFDFNPQGEYPKDKQYIGKEFSSELFSNSAIDFLRRYEEDKPFFMYVAYTAPHDPRMPPRKYSEMYDPDEIELPANFLPRHPFDNGELEIRDEKLAPWPRTPEVIKKHIAEYYGMISHLDDQVGRILAALEDAGHADNTIVIFAGDNGLAVGQHGLMGKQNLYEHSARVPLIIGGPGIPAGRRCDALCYLHDVFPTTCDLLGIVIPETVENRSLAQLVAGDDATVYPTVFGAYRDNQRMVRDRRYKLIEYDVDGKRTTQLFDEVEDPAELNDLSGDPQCSDQIERLRTEMRAWQEKVDDPVAGKWPA